MATDNHDEMYDSGQPEPAEHKDEADLEQYGVWVKAGPEDVDEEPQQGEDDFELSDLGDFDEGVEESAGLTDEEEDLLASLEEAEGGETQDGTTPSASDSSESDEGELEDLDIDLDEEGFETGEQDSNLSLSSGDGLDLSLPEDSSEQESADDEDFSLNEDTEREIDELSKELSAEDSGEVDESLDLDSIEIDGEPVSMEAPEEQPAPSETAGQESSPEPTSGEASSEEQELPSLEEELDEDLSLEDIDLEDEDLDVGLDLDEELDELSGDFGQEEEASSEPEEIEEVSMDSLTGEESTEESEPREAASEGGEDSELDLASIPSDSDLEEFSFDEEELETEDSGEELPELESEEDYFDDVSAVQSEMTEPAEEEPEVSVGHEQGEDMKGKEDTASQSGASSEALTALAGIERELSAIKSELTDLRAELATLRARESEEGTDSGEAEPAEASSAFEMDESDLIGAEEGDEDEGQAGGFFDDDEEDETIALTGDELDHILDSAEFTEETGTPSELEDLYADHSGGQEHSDAAGVEPAQQEEVQQQEGDEEPIEELTLEEMDDTEGTEESGEPEELDALDLEELDEEETDEEATGQEEPAEEAGPLDDMELEIGEGAHQAPAESAEPEGDDEVDALADMDIDSELAGIEELSDEEESEGGFDTSGLDEIDLGEAEEPAGDLEEAPGAPAETAGQEEAEPIEATASQFGSEAAELPDNLREEIKSVLSYMDQLLEALPEEKIQEFAQSEHFEVYKRLFEELGLEN